jgi:hypothetical protein
LVEQQSKVEPAMKDHIRELEDKRILEEIEKELQKQLDAEQEIK